jgi:hypothetical protein
MPDNGFLIVGLSNDPDLRSYSLAPNDASTAIVEEVGTDAGSKVRWFQIIGKRICNVMVEARGTSGQVVDSFQLAIAKEPPLKLPSASGSMSFSIEPDDPNRPGYLNIKVYTPASGSNYVEKLLEGVGFSIYMSGCHLYCKDFQLPILVPDSDIDFMVGKAKSIDDKIYPTRAAADAAILGAPSPANGAKRFAYYRGAGGALVVPTVFSPATTPKMIDTLLRARRMLASEVQRELTILAISLVGGMILKTLIPRILRIGASEPDPPAISLPKMPVNTQIPAEANAAARLIPPGQPIKVLVVGAETDAEFAYALKVKSNGGSATVVNPVRTPAADKFTSQGGTFVQNKIESLPANGDFSIIREDFPYPTDEYLDLTAAEARISRLEPGGSWVVVTEKATFADALQAAGELKGATVSRTQVPTFHEGVPTSSHPRDGARFVVILTKKQ